MFLNMILKLKFTFSSIIFSQKQKLCIHTKVTEISSRLSIPWWYFIQGVQENVSTPKSRNLLHFMTKNVYLNRVMIDIFWPNFQDMWTIIRRKFIPSYIHFWASLSIDHFSPIPSVLGHFHGHKLILIIDQKKWGDFEEKWEDCCYSENTPTSLH